MEFLSNPGSIIGDSGEPPLGTADCWLCIGQCVTTCTTQGHQTADAGVKSHDMHETPRTKAALWSTPCDLRHGILALASH